MDLFNDASDAKRYLTELINECISNHKDVKAAIKAKKAKVITAPSGGTVGVRLIGDEKTLNLPYSSRLSTSTDLAVNAIVWVWHCQSLNNGIVMQNANWTK